MFKQKGDKGIAGKILVPLDGSEIGEATLPYVEELVSILFNIQQ